jgi:hypothetical protein
MSFVSFSVGTCRALAVLVAVAASMAGAGGPGYAADSKNGAVLPSPKPMIGASTGAELVGKLLDERTTASDPDVPLPQRDLAVQEPAFVPLAGPRIYGRGEEGSIVVGLKIPIPAGRGALLQATRYGAAGTGGDTTKSARQPDTVAAKPQLRP